MHLFCCCAANAGNICVLRLLKFPSTVEFKIADLKLLLLDKQIGRIWITSIPKGPSDGANGCTIRELESDWYRVEATFSEIFKYTISHWIDVRQTANACVFFWGLYSVSEVQLCSCDRTNDPSPGFARVQICDIDSSTCEHGRRCRVGWKVMPPLLRMCR